MRTLMWGSSIVSLSLILFLGVEYAWGQIGVYYHVASPYGDQDVLGRRMGGATVALPDAVPHVLGNPAGLAYITRPTFFLSMSHARSNLDFTEIGSDQASSHNWSGGPALGYTAVSLPLKKFKRTWVVAAAYNGRQSPEYDDSYVSAVNEHSILNDEKDGHPGSASVGVGVQLTPSLSLGIGWTRWFGELKWRTVQAAKDTIINIIRQTSDYIGSGWQAGVMGQVGRLSLGTVIYFPQELMTGKGTRKIHYSTNDRSYQYSLKFNGAVKGGAAYRFGSGLTLGIGYSYQYKFVYQYTEQYREESRTYNEEYGSSTGLSGGIEYALHFNKARLPVYFRYRAIRMSEFDIFDIPGVNGLLGVSRTGQQRFNDQFGLGVSLIYGSAEFHLATQWTHRYLNITSITGYYLPSPVS